MNTNKMLIIEGNCKLCNSQQLPYSQGISTAGSSAYLIWQIFTLHALIDAAPWGNSTKRFERSALWLIFVINSTSEISHKLWFSVFKHKCFLS